MALRELVEDARPETGIPAEFGDAPLRLGDRELSRALAHRELEIPAANAGGGRARRAGRVEAVFDPARGREPGQGFGVGDGRFAVAPAHLFADAEHHLAEARRELRDVVAEGRADAAVEFRVGQGGGARRRGGRRRRADVH